ncbi:hypothetical protein [Nostoc sp. FACHB-190]|uniref:hypothetical protein n=1 Tax=Nostoc sp. FACHB-190 TaxID=2692838 RepID=UPI001687D47C|nr:hypothetical protein [Nostoc sp. FACHB-190]MBD2297850.1 hypothetical protein [Nostoc sp. FACHB-190]
MGLSEAELEEHCRYILEDRRILNKIVILCEGEIPKTSGRLSPQSYRNMDKMPDANFYHACVPRWWKQYRPQFINCGDRQDVLNTFFSILDLHNQNPANSYLSPHQLFAIVDLDIQIASIKNDYAFTDTDSIFYNLYEKAKINEGNCINHRIWVTGLVHKEAYFLTPDIQSVLDNYSNTPVYQDSVVNIEQVYLDIVDSLHEDIDLQNNLEKTFNRINYCSNLDFDDIKNFQTSWKINFINSQNNFDKNILSLALLTIAKAKKYWKQIQPPQGWTSSERAFRDGLTLEIGKFYSEQECDAKNHIPFFFKILYGLIEQE